MKATETNLLKFLKEPKQFIIPIYQRTYSWKKEQCQQLWNDIITAAKDETISGHFLGSLVYIESGLYQVSSLPQLLIIDGQQRLTTICLLLTALGKAIEGSDTEINITRRKIDNYYLFNNQEEDEDRYKLLLTQSDRETYIHLIENRELPEKYSQQIKDNYDFFVNQIQKMDLKELYSGIGKLIIVDISLDREKDNPQLIFESLNSTGLDLSQADLIRNYILMGLEPQQQKEIYNNYWYKIEQSFNEFDRDRLDFDKFMRYYLTVKSGNLPNMRDIYGSFKKYVQKHKNISIEEIVKDIYRYSKYFVSIAFDKEKSPKIKPVIADIKQLKVDVAYPFLLEVYDDRDLNIITETELVEILLLVESYVFRRAICGIPTNSMNKTFASLSRDIDKNNYLESVKQAFVSMKTYKRFPNNEEFRRELLVKDIYNLRNCHYLLHKLENFDRSQELVNTKELTIEHIMPQNPNLSLQWQQELGENWEKIQAQYLHTIGNLTLTGYNSQLSDRPFKDKRDATNGFADSSLRLNKSLAKLETWNEKKIQSRAELLADRAIKVWAFPDINLDDKN